MKRIKLKRIKDLYNFAHGIYTDIDNYSVNLRYPKKYSALHIDRAKKEAKDAMRLLFKPNILQMNMPVKLCGGIVVFLGYVHENDLNEDNWFYNHVYNDRYVLCGRHWVDNINGNGNSECTLGLDYINKEICVFKQIYSSSDRIEIVDSSKKSDSVTFDFDVPSGKLVFSNRLDDRDGDIPVWSNEYDVFYSLDGFVNYHSWYVENRGFLMSYFNANYLLRDGDTYYLSDKNVKGKCVGELPYNLEKAMSICDSNHPMYRESGDEPHILGKPGKWKITMNFNGSFTINVPQ